MQKSAVENNAALKLVDERIAFLSGIIKSAIARGDNRVEIFLDNVVNIIKSPIQGIFNLVRGIFGNSEKRQAEKISIADLQLRLTDLKGKRDEMQSAIELEVIKRITNYAATTRLIEQNTELIQRQKTYYQILNIDYKYGGSSTKEMLNAAQSINQLEIETNNLKLQQQDQIRDIERLVMQGRM